MHRQELLHQSGVQHVVGVGLPVDDDRRREWSGNELDYGDQKLALPAHRNVISWLHGGPDHRF
ncbi:Uncharacterised protein [Mycobacterium tuberculosis]|uniref:Uncharacterized protein n=1 Tax=Mycobacterium tuberculosis TaxID=1773 RepID=A0A916LD89_MYCTX|nr:Uncharacterised protein [Mycobacterium tuberculosis]COZ14305.1 Uncharacterised protein [Mycobacterium tuberculosis]